MRLGRLCAFRLPVRKFRPDFWRSLNETLLHDFVLRLRTCLVCVCSDEEVTREEVLCRTCSRQSLSAEDLGRLGHSRPLKYGKVLRHGPAYVLRYRPT